MKITSKEIHNFSKENLKEIVKDDINAFSMLKKGDLMSCFKIVSMLCMDKKIDVFVTLCPLLLDNKNNFEKNTGVKIMTPQELMNERKKAHKKT